MFMRRTTIEMLIQFENPLNLRGKLRKPLELMQIFQLLIFISLIH